MGKYTINELSRISGVKAHTIRAWEKRYNLFNPTRCMLNIRSYSDKDLDLLKCITVLKSNGMKIGDIASMSLDQIDHEIHCCCQKRVACVDHEDVITGAIQTMKADKFERWIEARFDDLGVENAMVKEIFPLLIKLQLLLMTGDLARIKYDIADQVIIRKVSAAIEMEKALGRDRKKALLVIPQSDGPSCENLFLNYLLVARGYRTLNIGSTYDLMDIKLVINNEGGLDLITIMLTDKFNYARPTDYVRSLVGLSPTSEYVICGYQTKSIHELNLPNLKVIEKLADMANGCLS